MTEDGRRRSGFRKKCLPGAAGKKTGSRKIRFLIPELPAIM